MLGGRRSILKCRSLCSWFRTLQISLSTVDVLSPAWTTRAGQQCEWTTRESFIHSFTHSHVPSWVCRAQSHAGWPCDVTGGSRSHSPAQTVSQSSDRHSPLMSVVPEFLPSLAENTLECNCLETNTCNKKHKVFLVSFKSLFHFWPLSSGLKLLPMWTKDEGTAVEQVGNARWVTHICRWLWLIYNVWEVWYASKNNGTRKDKRKMIWHLWCVFTPSSLQSQTSTTHSHRWSPVLHLKWISVVDILQWTWFFFFSAQASGAGMKCFEAQMLCHKFTVGQSGLCKLVATIKM